MSFADDDVKRDDVTEGTLAATDVDVTDRRDFTTSKSDVGRGHSSRSAEIHAANLRVNCNKVLDRSTSERHCEVGDNSVEKLSVPDPSFSTERSGHSGYSEYGLGDASMPKSSMSIHELSDEARNSYTRNLT